MGSTALIRAKLKTKQHYFWLGCLSLAAIPLYAPAQGYILNNINKVLQVYDEETFQTVVELNEIVVTLKGAPDTDKLKAINNFFNSKLQYADDRLLWEKPDYWATPLESINRKAGDCEDYVIAKYTFLKTLRVSTDKLRLTYVRATIGTSARAHMVLSYYPTLDGEPLILDNLTPEILPASSRPDLKPIYSFNDKKLWVGGSKTPKTNSQSHLSKWRGLLSRMRKNKI